MKTGLQLWAGTPESHDAYLEGMLKAHADAGFKAELDFDEEILGRILSVQAGVGVINISGSLVNGSAGFGVYFGVMGYNDIRNALAAAVADPEVGAILLNVGSHGGAVDGVHETSQLIARVNTIKPVITYTGSAMASAALWLGSQGRFVYTAETATVGSLGVMMIHVDRTQQLAQDGVKATIVRAGIEKNLANPYEQLTEKAKAQLQEQADQLYDIFLAQVALGRGLKPAAADKLFGQGRVFLGHAAHEAKLVDAVGTYEDAFAKAQSLIKTAKAPSSSVRNIFGATNTSAVQAQASTTAGLVADNLSNPLQGNEMPPKPLSVEQLAAIAAGVDLNEQTPEQLADAGAKDPALELAKLKVPELVPGMKPVSELGAPVAAAGASEAVSTLQAMLATAHSDLILARVNAAATDSALAAAKQAATDATAQAASFVNIARASIRTMGVHFGVSQEAAAAMSASEVLAEHTRLADLFKAKFKIDGVAAAVSEKPEANAGVPIMSIRDMEIARKLPRAK